MLRQFLLGGGVSVINIAIHSLVMAILVRIAQLASAKDRLHPVLFLAAVMIPIVTVLMATRVFEVLRRTMERGAITSAPP